MRLYEYHTCPRQKESGNTSDELVMRTDFLSCEPLYSGYSSICAEHAEHAAPYSWAYFFHLRFSLPFSLSFFSLSFSLRFSHPFSLPFLLRLARSPPAPHSEIFTISLLSESRSQHFFYHSRKAIIVLWYVVHFPVSLSFLFVQIQTLSSTIPQPSTIN